MKRLLVLLSLIFSSHFQLCGQVDTLDLDLDKAALDMKQCRGFVRLDVHQKLSSPPLDSWTAADSTFFLPKTLFTCVYPNGGNSDSPDSGTTA